MASLGITDITVYVAKDGENGRKGWGSCVIGGLMKVEFGIIEGRKGLFASLPSRQWTDKDGQKKY